MSSQSFRRPDFRLLLGYPDVTLTRTGATLPLGKTQAESPDFTEALRGFAAEVARARGRLVVVLPEIEVWRDRPVLAGRSLGARRRDALAIGAEGLGMPLQAVAVVLGETAADGTTPVAAVRRGTLSETRALLARVGLRPAAIVGGGAFPGFATPPRLGGWPWRLPKMPRLPPRHFALGAGAVAAAAAMVLALPHGAPQPVPLPAQETAPAIELASAHVEPARAEPITPPALPRAAPPKHRPDNLAAPSPPQPIVTQATRNVPLVLTEPRRGEVPELRLAELSTARVRMTDAAMMTPLRRPAPTAGPGAAPELAAPAPKAASGPRPLPRPLTEAAAPTMPVPAVAAAVAATASRSPGAAPMPRPAARPPVPTLVVASLDPEALVAESIAAAAAAAMTRPAPGPLARPAGLKIPAKAGPAPKVVATRKAAPAPKVLAAPVRQASLAAAPAPQKARTATPKPVAAKPAAPKPAAPKPVAAKPVAPKPVAAKPATPKPATTRGGLRRGNMALIGVFGGSNGRHALIRMPNGAIERVSAGDHVQGVQVAAIGADSVRLNHRGRDTLLTLPE